MRILPSLGASSIWSGASFVFAVLIAIIAVPIGLTRLTDKVRYENLDLAQPATQLAEELLSAF
jgi:hypothetical protein